MASVLKTAVSASTIRAAVQQQQRRVRGPESVASNGSVVVVGAAAVFSGSAAASSAAGHGRLAAIASGGRRQMSQTSRMRRGGRGIADAVVDAVAVPETESATAFRISEKFAELKERGQVAFIPYLTAGDPDLQTTATAAKMLEKYGADVIELGVPYSDPLADGPVLQAAANRAINGGTNLDSVLTLLREDLADIKVPFVLFVYYNPLLKRGVEKFLKEAKAAGASGLVIPDLPIEGTGKLRKLTTAAGLELVLLTTPTTPTLRMEAITEASQGFVYLVSLTGVTGARVSIESRVEGLLKDIKKVSDKPVAVGFGVSTPEQAAKLVEWGADGVIIGSAVVKLVGESASPEEGLKALEEFAIQIRAALDSHLGDLKAR